MSAQGKFGTMTSILFLVLSLLITGFSNQALATPSLLSVSISPNLIPSNSSASLTAKVTEACPAGGCSVSLSSSNAILPVPNFIVIPEGALSASTNVNSGNNISGADISLTVQASMGGINKFSYPRVSAAIVGPYLVSMTTNVGDYVYSGSTLSVTFKVSEPCPSSGCAVAISSGGSSILSLPSSFTIPAGATQGTLSVIVGNTTYPVPVSFYATFNKATIRSIITAVFAPLSPMSADGSYTMKGFGSSSRTGTGSTTAAQNDYLARSNMNSNISSLVSRQCRAVNPSGELVGLSAASRVGEFTNSSGLLTYEYTQNIKCSSSATQGWISSVAQSFTTSINVGTSFTLTVCLKTPVAGNSVVSLKTREGNGLPLPATMTIPAGSACGSITAKATSGGYSTRIQATLNYIMVEGAVFTIN